MVPLEHEEERHGAVDEKTPKPYTSVWEPIQYIIESGEVPDGWDYCSEAEACVFGVTDKEFERLVKKNGGKVGKYSTVTDILYDTPKGWLAAQGITLRLRSRKKSHELDILLNDNRNDPLVHQGVKYRLRGINPFAFTYGLLTEGFTEYDRRTKEKTSVKGALRDGTPWELTHKRYPFYASSLELEAGTRDDVIHAAIGLGIPLARLSSEGHTELKRRGTQLILPSPEITVFCGE